MGPEDLPKKQLAPLGQVLQEQGCGAGVYSHLFSLACSFGWRVINRQIKGGAFLDVPELRAQHKTVRVLMRSSFWC